MNQQSYSKFKEMIGSITDNTTTVISGGIGGDFTLNDTCAFWFNTDM